MEGVEPKVLPNVVCFMGVLNAVVMFVPPKRGMAVVCCVCPNRPGAVVLAAAVKFPN